MKEIIALVGILVSIASSGSEIKLEKFWGEGKAGWSGELEECSVQVKKVYDNGDILVKSSYDSLLSRGYVLSRVNEKNYKFSDVVDKTGTIVEVRFDDDGNVAYYNRSELKNIVITHTVANFWCEI